MNQEKIGKFILENRKKKNLTQSELAKRLKVSNHTISNWENGKSMPSYELLIPLTKELDISITELINGEFESNKEEPNKIVEKTINFLKKIDQDKKKKYRNIGILIIIIGFIIKFLAMILIECYQETNDYYFILSFVVTIIGISYLFHEENAKNVILKTIGGTLISLLLFTSIDIAEIKLFDTGPRYFVQDQSYLELRYFRTPFYDVYACAQGKDRWTLMYPDNTDYFIVPKTKIQDLAVLRKKYCENK